MFKESPKIKLAIQMFNLVAGKDWASVHSENDVYNILSKLKDAGYLGCEWCNFQFEDLPFGVEKIRAIMDSLGLKTPGCHFHYRSSELLQADCEQAVERSLILGCDKLIFAYSIPSTFGIEPDSDGNYAPSQIDEWTAHADKVLDTLKKACSETGIKVLYHNHDKELLKGTDGRYFLDSIHPDGYEMDVYWVAKGLDGKVSTALDYIKAHKDKTMLLHAKDGLNGSVFTGEMCGWGKGTYPLKEIVGFASQLGHEWIISENDAPLNFGTTGLEDAIESAAYAYADLL